MYNREQEEQENEEIERIIEEEERRYLEGGRRGRPIGTTGERPEKQAVVTWKPIHEQVVMLHLAGYINTEIAEITGYTPTRVAALLLDPRARELIEEGRKAVVEKLLDNIDGRLVQLATRSLDNLEKTVNADIAVKHRAKVHQDKVGMKLLEMIGYGGSNNRQGVSGGGDPTGNALPVEVAERLTRALERSERVQQIDIKQKEVSVVEQAEEIVEVPVKTGTDG